MSAINILSVTNNKDNSTCTVVFDRAPASGATLTFYAQSGVPKSDFGTIIRGVTVSATPQNSTTYTLTMPTISTTSGDVPARLYYISALENSTWSAYQGDATKSAPVWIGWFDDDDLCLIVKELEQRINDNAGAINARLQRYYPGMTLWGTVRGWMSQIKEYPAIEITADTFSEPYVAAAYQRRHAVTCTITGFVVTDQPKSDGDLIVAFGRSVQKILNHPEYDHMTIAGGITLVGCMADDMRLTSTWMQERWISTFELTWNGYYQGAIV